MKLLLAAALLASAACTTAPAAPSVSPGAAYAPSATESEDILKVIDAFLLAVGNGDAAGMKATQYDDGKDAFVSIKSGAADPVRRRATTELQQVPADFDPFIERYWDPVIELRGPIAHVWAPYELRDNGAVVHCGIDAFQLVRESSGWKIHSLMFTMEPDACDAMRPASPAAMRPRDGWRETRNE